jgi:2-oxo-4-hydroxy-4-carboxy-5-ureidoimidazoline decarboxylase
MPMPPPTTTTMTTKRPPVPIAALNACDRDAFVAALGHIFERSPWVAEATYDRHPFRDAPQLHGELCAALRAAPEARQLELIRAHPDLAGRLSRPADLTGESRSEQASAGLDSLTQDEGAELARLNRAYRERFGFPFVICARLSDRKSILAALRHRLENDTRAEREVALAEIEKIAWLRLQDAVES